MRSALVVETLLFAAGHSISSQDFQDKKANLCGLPGQRGNLADALCSSKKMRTRTRSIEIGDIRGQNGVAESWLNFAQHPADYARSLRRVENKPAKLHKNKKQALNPGLYSEDTDRYDMEEMVDFGRIFEVKHTSTAAADRT
jgi:hypothetical protein